MQAIWEYEDYIRFLNDSNLVVKEWAFDRIVKLFRERAGEVLDGKRQDEVIGKRVQWFFEDEKRRENLLQEQPAINLETAKVEKALNYLLKHKENIPGQEQVIRFLVDSEKRDEIIRISLEKLRDRPDWWGAIRAMRLLGKIKAAEAVPEIIKGIGKDASHVYFDTAIETLISIGEPALEPLEGMLKTAKDNADQIIFALGVLEGIPYQRSVNMVLKNFSCLWDEFNEPLLNCIYYLGSKKFIEPLKKELRHDELLAEETYYLLCKLHRTEDPRLMDIRHRIEKSRKKEASIINSIKGEGDPGDWIDKYIILELKCTKCQKKYSYKVKDVYYSVDKNTESNDTIIRDTIVCKNCKAVDQYEYTKKALMTLTATLMKMTELKEKYGIDIDQWPLKIGILGSFKGKTIKPAELLSEYQREVKKNPDSPELRIGLGNTLGNMKRHEEALVEYRKAVELNPGAVEGWASIARYYADRGDYKNAYKYNKKCIEHLPHADFYRVRDINEFKAAVYSNMDYASENLDNDELLFLDEKPMTQPIRNQKIGRNEPCPCGSGKKYKKCCLLKKEAETKAVDIEEKVSSPNTTIADTLRERILEYLGNNIALTEQENAYQIYSGGNIKDPKKHETNVGFIDWFIHDYRLKDSGKTIIEKFYNEKSSSIPTDEREILKDWLDTKPGLYEVISIRPNQGVTLRDIFTEKEYEVIDINTSNSVVKWDILHARVIKIFNKYYLSGMGILYPANLKKELIEFGREKHREYEAGYGSITWEQFIRNRGYLFKRYKPQQRSKKFHTAEGHQIAETRVHFQIRDMEEIIARLARVDDFEKVKEEFDNKGFSREIQYVWLKRGESENIPQTFLKGKEGFQISSKWSESPKGPFITTLGDLTLTKEELVLESISEKRLEFGKKRLKELLKDNIHFRVGLSERFSSIKKRLNKIPEEARKEPQIPLPIRKQAFEKAMGGYHEEWINKPIPALDEKTPLDAIKTPEGRQKVEDLLKIMENTQERSKKDGQPYFDINKIKKNLGL